MSGRFGGCGAWRSWLPRVGRPRSCAGALLQELGLALQARCVTLVPRGGASDDAAAVPASSAGQTGGVEQAGRELVLHLRWSAAAGEAVVMVARAPRRLGADEAAVAGTLFDVAGVALALIDARVEAASDELTVRCRSHDGRGSRYHRAHGCDRPPACERQRRRRDLASRGAA